MTGNTKTKFAVHALAIVTAAMVMRGPVTCVGPMADAIMQAFAVSVTDYGLLAALPIVAFGVFSFVASPLTAPLGLARAAVTAMIILLIGAVARLFDSWTVLLLGTLAVGAGIALLNVIMPVLLKSWCGSRTATMMGLYTGVIGLSGAVGGLTSIPVMQTFGGISAAFGLWVVLIVSVVVFWSCKAIRNDSAERVQTLGASGGIRALAGSVTVWALVLVMGLQSLLVYTVGAWLSPYLTARGASPETAGFWFFVFLASGLPASMATPAFMKRVGSEAAVAMILGGLYLLGIAGWLANEWFWCMGSIAAGVSQGAMLSVAFLLIAAKSQDNGEMLAMSALAQGVGYVLAGLGPIAFACMYKVAGWGPSWWGVMTMVCIWTASGLVASRTKRLLKSGAPLD